MGRSCCSPFSGTIGGDTFDSGGDTSDSGGDTFDSDGDTSDSGGDTSDSGGDTSDSDGDTSDSGGDTCDTVSPYITELVALNRHTQNSSKTTHANTPTRRARVV